MTRTYRWSVRLHYMQHDVWMSAPHETSAPLAHAPSQPACLPARHLTATFRSQVVRQWLTARGVTPLRVVLTGPPMVGKSVLGARLAAAYHLPLFAAKDLLAAADKLSPEDAKVWGVPQ